MSQGGALARKDKQSTRSGGEALFSIMALTLALTLTLARRCAVEGHVAPARTQMRSTALPPPVPPAKSLFAPLVGEEKHYVTRPGDTLLAIARAHFTDPVTLARLNHLSGERVRPGRTLLLPTLMILPAEIADGLMLNIPERRVYFFRKGHYVARYPVAVGMLTWETPIGRFRLVRKVMNPVWVPPRVMVEREGISNADVPPGPNNPLGDRWMGWSAPEVGFHSTYAVQSVGKLASHACVRMYPEHAHQLFPNVGLGMPIHSLYEPIKLGRRDSDCYLSVSPDVYRRNRVSLAHVQQKLEQAQVWNRADKAQIRRILAEQDGYPHRIARLDSNASADRNK